MVSFLYEEVGIFAEAETLRKQLLAFTDRMILYGLNRKIVANCPVVVPVFYFRMDQIPVGSRIILYGAGEVGRSYQQLIRLTACYDIVVWVDQNDQACRACGDLVRPVEDLRCCEFDYIVVAVLNEKPIRPFVQICVNGLAWQKIPLFGYGPCVQSECGDTVKKGKEMFYLFAALLGGLRRCVLLLGNVEICLAGSEKQRAAHHDVQQLFLYVGPLADSVPERKGAGRLAGNQKNVKTVAIYGMGVMGRQFAAELTEGPVTIAYAIDQAVANNMYPFPFIP